MSRLSGSLSAQRGAISGCRRTKGLQTWRRAGNKWNKKSRTDGKGCPSARVLGEVLRSPPCKKKKKKNLTCYETLHKVSGLESSFGITQAVERRGLLWLRIETGGGCLGMRFHKMQGISRPAEDMLASQQGLCFMKLVRYLVR